MRVTTWNVNGMRAALRKGFAEHLERLDPDVLLLQEVRATPEQLPDAWVVPRGYFVHWHPAKRRGYAGTAIWSKHPFDFIETGLGRNDPDAEGRVITARVNGVQVSSIYLPSGSSSEAAQAKKEQWMRRFRTWVTRQKAAKEPALLGGDLNIAHTPRDIYYARANEKNSGFLPHERAWFSRLLGSGWHDLLREQVGDCHGPYSWWSNRGKARQLDRGWRIDYLLGNDRAAAKCLAASIDRDAGLACSDHAPVTVELG